MKVETTTDAAEFRSRTDAFLGRDPLRHTVITTGIANTLGDFDSGDEPTHFLSVHDGDAVVGVAMRGGGRDMYLGELAGGSVGLVAEALAELIPDAGGVEGAIDDVLGFGERWCALRGGGFHPTYATRLYRLGTLRTPDAAGSPRRAAGSDVELCARWSDAMRAESGMRPQGWTREVVAKRVAAGRWWLWERDGRPVCVAAHHVPALGWARIGPVYTPPAERGHGYASMLTAHVARTLRADGIDACLFAETANPTSNKIYRAIGFEAVREFVHYEFG
ncbi:GNAT family N-acetyltransferase [Nocardia australiensis]|uniref:GNAT family N-acetyltransferase n=1 Tax=Nocardia australiensis TaxID=2887191 RepID=UPI001D1545F3|nr:GNAT family N-acetyltransferase [Nocardia australiensis]